MTFPSDPKEDVELIQAVIAGLAEHGLEGFKGPILGTLWMRVNGHPVQFLKLEVQGAIHFNELRNPTSEAIILETDTTRRSKTKKKVLEVVRTLRYRHRIMTSRLRD